MNKIYSKIAALSVGLAMAIGVGVAVGTKEVAKADAAFYTELECDFSKKTTNHNKYDDDNGDNGLWAYNDDFTVFSGANNNGAWAYVKMGGKSATLENFNPVYVKTTTATINEISKVDVSILANTGSNTKKMGATWKLIVASDSAFENVIDEVDKGSLTVTSAGSYTFEPTSGTPWAAGSYYKVEWTITNTSTTNGVVWVEDIKLSYSQTVLTPDEIIVSGEDSVVVGSSTTLSSVAKLNGSSEGVNQNVIWSSSNNIIAKVSSSGVVTGVSNGVVQIRATAEDTAAVYCDFEFTVIGGKTTDTLFNLLPSYMPTNYGDNYFPAEGVYLHAVSSSNNNDSGFIQMQNKNGYIENVAALPYELKSVEVKFEAPSGKSQGTGFAVNVSADGENFTAVEGAEVEAGTDIFRYTVSEAGQIYFKLTSATSGTSYLRYVMFTFGNANEAKMVSLATSLNTMLDEDCQGASDNSPITEARWGEIAAAYEAGDADGKAALAAVTGNSYYEVNKLLSRYDYIVGTYGYSNFLNREVQASSAIRVASDLIASNDNTMIIVITIAAVSALAFTTLLVFKKKKQK